MSEAPRRSPEARLAHARVCNEQGRAAEALAIWRALADEGHVRAQASLGACLATGHGTERDPGAARQWLERAARSGDLLAQRNLGTLLLETDPPAAATWYRRAAEQGDAASQDQLSRMLLAGEAVIQDLAGARHWAERAAVQGIAAAAARLGTLHHEAKGGPRDTGQAVRWWRQAAEAGDGDAAARLGAALHLGQGVAADQVAAMAWLIIAAGRHSTLVRGFFARVDAALTGEERARAKALASAWETT